MDMLSTLVLPPDVIIVPAGQLPTHLRNQIEFAPGDHALLRSGTRSYSKIVDAEAVQLLEKFRTPRTIAEAVLLYSVPRRADPEQALLDAYPLLKLMMQARFLVPEGSEEAGRIAASLGPGDRVGDFVVRRPVQVLDDSELYQVEDLEGTRGALKIVRGAGAGQQARLMEREASILKRLDGRVNPRPLGEGVHNSRRYLAVEWFDGVSPTETAAKLRPSDTGNSRRALVALCCSIADAYAHLRTQGVIHGDVHPKNVLVTEDGSVKIIDFGLSRLAEAEGLLALAERGGVSSYFEPEYARAQITGESFPPTSFAGEQYSVAALLYTLFTGSSYVEFSLEPLRQLEQVVNEAPLPFYKRSVGPWPEVERVLRIALSKTPAERYASMAAFAAALREAGAASAGVAAHSEGAASGDTPPAARALLRDVLHRLGFASPFFASGVTNAPSCSVTYGAAGIAHALYRISVARQDAQLLSLADLWSQKALRTMGEPTAFYHPHYDVRPETVGHTTPYHTASGIHAVQAHIAHALGDQAGQYSSTAAFIAASQAPCENLDLTLGRSGTLLAGAMLLDIAPRDQAALVDSLRSLGGGAMHTIWEEIGQLAAVQDQRRIDYLGVAHGWAGILYATLRWCRSAGTVLPAGVPERLQQLAACAEPWGHGLRWPAILDKQIYMPGWCNGSAGFVYLWTLAHETYGEPTYLELAEKAAWNIWEGPDSLPSLCCGLAGRAYALLRFYKHSGDRSWLSRARELAERAAIAVQHNPDLANSLYKGELGIAALAADLEHPEAACLPFFEEEGWLAS